MKRITILFLFTSIFAFRAYAQELNFTVKADSIKENGKTEYLFTINIISDQGPFNLFLFDQELMNGGNEIKSEMNVSNSTYTFKTSEYRKRFCIAVQSEDKKITKSTSVNIK